MAVLVVALVVVDAEPLMARAPEPEAPRKPPKPVRLRGRRPLTARDIEAAIAAGRD